jgi:hypothetical protein
VPITTGGKTRLGRITKMGDRYLRKLLVVGACATLRHRRGHSDAMRLWASGMLERKTVKYKFNLTAVALANKVARIVFALMTGAANTTTGRSQPERRGYSIGVFAAKAISIEGVDENGVNQRQRLGSPNSGRRQYERDGMMRRSATRASHPGQRIHPFRINRSHD